MSSILDRYGIQEVCDFTFYKIGNDGKPLYPVLYLDTLKVSTVEQTAETTMAQGGKGNPPLIMWDYNKNITVTLEDALFSMKSLSIMYGQEGMIATTGTTKNIMRTELFTATGSVATASMTNSTALVNAGWESLYKKPNGATATKYNAKFYVHSATGTADAAATSIVQGETYLCTYDLQAKDDVEVIEINADTFPGYYYAVGDTYARRETDGEDEFFQFIIPKCKITSEHTITITAGGEPTVFNMNLQVLRPGGNEKAMMKLVKYNLADGTVPTDDVKLWHNHELVGGSNGAEPTTI